ncbi:MAG: NnrS family protein [Ahniella sp.]|nr:NnrS family protein [Ahniella sp.]
MSTQSDVSPGLQPALRLLAAAPHRLMFFIGACNVLAAMTWWAFWLAGVSVAPLAVPGPMLHAWLMQYLVLPAFMFGFLLTVFPRWLGLGAAQGWHYVPVGLGLVSAQALTLVAAWSGSGLALWLGWINTLAAWLTGLVILAGWLWRDRDGDWHARSALAAMGFGLIGVILFGLGLYRQDAAWWRMSSAVATFGLLVPVYVTVAHRMFPFFAANVVAGYRPWKPRFLLPIMWLGSLGHLVLDVSGHAAWRAAPDLFLAGMGFVMLWRWWPRNEAPPLLRVLFIGFGWWPVAMSLFATDALLQAAGSGISLGRAPLHALAIGFFGSLLVAMVTRVTAGHSGRPLLLGPTAAFAFAGMHALALLRMAADFVPNPLPLWVASAFGWLVLFLPWVLRSCFVYLSPRVDGRAG